MTHLVIQVIQDLLFVETLSWFRGAVRVLLIGAHRQVRAGGGWVAPSWDFISVPGGVVCRG